MKLLDLITIIENISEYIGEIQRLVSGFAYVLGLILMFIAIMKYREAAEKAGSQSTFVPTAYLLSGAALLFLPAALNVVSATTFGASTVLSYRTYNTNDLLDAITLIVRTAGLIWFVRGCVLLAHASEPGVQHGPKGMTFLIAGILAFNFEMTFASLVWVMEKVVAYTTRYG